VEGGGKGGNYRLSGRIRSTPYTSGHDDMLVKKHSLVRCECSRAVCKVRGLTLLLRVGTLWRFSDSLFFEIPPLAGYAPLTKLHPLLENVLQIVGHFEISCLGAPFSWLERHRNRMGRDLDRMADVLMGFHQSTFIKPNTEFNSDLTPCDLFFFSFFFLPPPPQL
jgi:hypothetical protein